MGFAPRPPRWIRGRNAHQGTARERAESRSIRSELGSTRGSAFTVPSFNEYPSLLPDTLSAVSTDFQTPRSASAGRGTCVGAHSPRAAKCAGGEGAGGRRSGSCPRLNGHTLSVRQQRGPRTRSPPSPARLSWRNPRETQALCTLLHLHLLLVTRKLGWWQQQ